MSTIDRLDSRVEAEHELDRVPIEAGLPFEPGLGDRIMFETGHLPVDTARGLGYAALHASDKVKHIVIDVWSN